MAEHDLIIRGGTVIDGTGAAGRVADVAVKTGRIAAIGDVPSSGTREIDAEGLAVCPGFIDTAMTRSVPTHANGLPTHRLFPGMVSAAEAARRFLDGLAADKAVVTFPTGLYLAAGVLARAPLPVADFLLRLTPTRLGALWGPTRPEHCSPTPDRAWLDAAAAKATKSS